MLKLTSDKKTSYAVTIFTLAALLLTLVLKADFIRWSAAAVLCACAALVLSLVKKRSILSHHKREVLLLMLVSAVLYLLLYYVSGLYFGFGLSFIDLTPKNLFNYVLPIAAVVLLIEYIRAILLGQESRFVSIIAYLAGVTAEVLIAGGVRGINSAYEFADFFGITLLPAITSNLLYNYISKRYGMLPNVVYRMILIMYQYLIPFIPNVPPVLSAFSLLILPLLILGFICLLYEKKVKLAKARKSRLTWVFTIAVVVISIAFTMLVSCEFRYGILVIGSPSMTGEINVGDAIVYEDYDYCDSLKENDIIVFSKNGSTMVVHRIVEVNTENSQRQYITKGDANEDADLGFVTDDQIIGVVRFKVLYIGYPSLWLRKIFE